jgi:SsrA-binding protein
MADPVDGKTIRNIARNKRARHDYQIGDEFEAGIALVGSEVKVLRQGRLTLTGAHVRVVRGEAFVFGMQIPEYEQANRLNHAVDRPRKLLLRRRQIERIDRDLSERGATCVVLSVYFKGALVKVQIALAKGKRRHDKRHALRDREASREAERDMSRRR